jgi:hypothetical protein
MCALLLHKAVNFTCQLVWASDCFLQLHYIRTKHHVCPQVSQAHVHTYVSFCHVSLCRSAIDRLRQQNAKLKEDLLLENKFSVRPSNPGATQMINKLQDEADLYTRKVSTKNVHVGQPECIRA